MTTSNLRAMCPNLKNNNNEDLPVDRWGVSSSSAPEWTRQAWMEPWVAMNLLLFHDWWMPVFYNEYQRLWALKMNMIGSRWCDESYTSLYNNVTQIVTWPITSYGWINGGAGDTSRAPRAPKNRFGKTNSFHFNIEIEKPTHWFNFWTSVTLSV